MLCNFQKIVQGTVTNAATIIATGRAKGIKVKLLRNISAYVELNDKNYEHVDFQKGEEAVSE